MAFLKHLLWRPRSHRVMSSISRDSEETVILKLFNLEWHIYIVFQKNMDKDWKQDICGPLAATPKQFTNRWQLLLLPITFFMGSRCAFISGDFTQVCTLLTCITRKQTLRSLSSSSQKKDGCAWPRPSFFWYDANFSKFDSADIIDYVLEKSVSCQKKASPILLVVWQRQRP